MSDTLQSTLGVKQGCPLSPTLFGIYIDDFQAELEAAGADLDLPTLCGVQAPALFYADDLDLVSTSVRGLQAQLDLLESYCKRWRLTVNVKKTKVVVRSLNAYGREGEPCHRCGTPIRREQFMNRSSFSCPRCQPRPRTSLR